MAVDPQFLPSEAVLIRPLRSVVEESLLAYGCAVALALVKGDRPSRSQLSDVVRQTIAVGHWDGIGQLERTALGVAIADLFMRPDSHEADLLGRLAVTATAYGLIQALPSVDEISRIAPKRLYLDTTCILPLLTRVEPRFSAYSPMITKSLRIALKPLFLETFIQELVSHYRNALRTLEAEDFRTIAQLDAAMAGPDDEHINVFLLMLLQGKYPSIADPRAVLESMYKQPTTAHFRSAVQALGVEVVPASNAAGESVEILTSEIMSAKQNCYERSADARRLLARNEAVQLLQLSNDNEAGEHAWFATGDGQLRRIARSLPIASADAVLPVAGVVALLEALGHGYDLAPTFPRVLWMPTLMIR